MNRCPTPMAVLLATTLAMASLPAQEHSVSFTLLLQVPPGDIVLNKPLVDALLDEPELHTALKAEFGGAYENLLKSKAELPAPHMAGTFQVHVGLLLAGKGPFGDAERAKATDVVVAHLKSRLEALLVTEPTDRLHARRAELRDRLQSLLTEQAALTESTRASRNLLDSKHEKSRTLGDELLAARIDLATAQSTQQRLDRMQLENTRLRTDLQQDRDAVLDDVNRLRSRLAALPVALAELQRTNQAFREEVEARKAEIAAAGKELRPAEVRLDAANERLADVNRILAVVLEQLPNQALQLQRAEARITALIQELEQIPSLDAETGARARVTDNEAKLERLAIDLAVTKTLLTEVEGRLARIQPLQCRLLRARG